MKLRHILFLLCFCILINCNSSDDQNLSSRLSFRKTSSGWNRVNLGPKVLKKRRKVLKRRPSTGTKSSFIRPYNRDSRFFSIFTIVRFQNEPCVTSAFNNGTCYTKSDCANRGGVAQGSCASGFGVCCYFEYTCGKTTSENGTYFSSPATPARICNLLINRINDDICQVKVEFDLFDLSDPDQDGQCSTDFFLATGGSPVPQLCGTNSGQHIIYSVTPNSGPSQLSIVMDTTTTTTSSRTWNMRIYQHDCKSQVLAPNGCLQYYQGASGQVQSFNYKIEVNNNQPNHLANLNYAICIRMESGFCGIRYAQVDPFSFTLSENAMAITAATTLGTPMVKYGDSECSMDYIVVPGASLTGSDADKLFARDRFCGTALGYCMSTSITACQAMVGAITTFSKPFILRVVTDANEDGNNEMANRGFNLVFSQQPCLTSG